MVTVKEENFLDALEQAANDILGAGGAVYGRYMYGKLLMGSIPADKLYEIASDYDVSSIWPETQVQAFMVESAPQINAPAAWDAGYTGKGVKIAVLDTGIDKNNEMIGADKVVSEVSLVGLDANDYNGHGTQVASIAAGTEWNGLKGIAPDALLLNVKVLRDDGVGSSFDVIRGINWAVENGAQVMVMSFGALYSNTNDPIDLAIRDAVQAGVVVVTAAGNCGEECTMPFCGSFRGVGVPGDSPYAITVGAVDEANEHACFSAGADVNGDLKPDVVAPGVSVDAAMGSMSGTSASAPMVAGAVALLLEDNTQIIPSQAKQALEETATDLGVSGDDIKYGHGLLNAEKLLELDIMPPVIRVVNLLRYIKGGEYLEIKVETSEEYAVSGLEGTMHHPDASVTEFSFNKESEGFYTYVFPDTTQTGEYLLEVKALYGEGLEETREVNFKSLEGDEFTEDYPLNYIGLFAEPEGTVHALGCRVDKDKRYPTSCTRGAIDFKIDEWGTGDIEFRYIHRNCDTGEYKSAGITCRGETKRLYCDVGDDCRVEYDIWRDCGTCKSVNSGEEGYPCVSDGGCDSGLHCSDDGLYYVWYCCPGGSEWDKDHCEGAGCTSGWMCKDSTHKGYRWGDCSWTNVDYCPNGCSGGECIPGSECTEGWKCNAEVRGSNWLGHQSDTCSWSSVENCDLKDGWYCVSGTSRENRNYRCSGGQSSCAYSIVQSENCQSGYQCVSGQCVPPTCSEGWICVGSWYKAYRHADCTQDPAIYCQYGCSGGSCNSPPSLPDLAIYGSDITFEKI